MLQSENHGCFLVRSFLFTSRTTHSFFSVIIKDYEGNLPGLSCLLRGKPVVVGTNIAPMSTDDMVIILRAQVDSVFEYLSMMKHEAAPNTASSDYVAQLQSANAQPIQRLRREDLLSLLNSPGRS